MTVTLFEISVAIMIASGLAAAWIIWSDRDGGTSTTSQSGPTSGITGNPHRTPNERCLSTKQLPERSNPPETVDGDCPTVEPDTPEGFECDVVGVDDWYHRGKPTCFVRLTEPRLVWKGLENGVAELTIPEGAIVHMTKDKCRATHAYANNLFLDVGYNVGVSKHKPSFQYGQGDLVTPDEGFDYEYEECTGGIHFFIEPERAVVWSNASNAHDMVLEIIHVDYDCRHRF